MALISRSLMKILLPLLISIFVLSACATPYQQKGFTGGFSDVQLAENMWKVNFNGNSYTSAEKSTNYTLLRCAELCLENGFSYFTVGQMNDAVNRRSKPRASVIMECHKKKFQSHEIVYDAHFIRSSMRSKLGI